jgi:hypothetical protein
MDIYHGAPAWRRLGEYVTLDRKFYSLLFKQDVVAARVIPNFLAYRIPLGGIAKKYNKYNMH